MRARGGITFEDVIVGEGPIAERGTTVDVRYNGYLNRGELFQENVIVRFKIGQRRVVAGLEYGVEGMRVGGRRIIYVPPHLGYAASSVPGIPPNAKLVFDVQLLNAA